MRAGVPFTATGQQLDDGASQFLYGATGLYAHSTSTQAYYYLTDGHGSVLAEVKSHGTNAVSYQCDVYGTVLNQPLAPAPAGAARERLTGVAKTNKPERRQLPPFRLVTHACVAKRATAAAACRR